VADKVKAKAGASSSPSYVAVGSTCERLQNPSETQNPSDTFIVQRRKSKAKN
jgi:hypothetical protein